MVDKVRRRDGGKFSQQNVVLVRGNRYCVAGVVVEVWVSGVKRKVVVSTSLFQFISTRRGLERSKSAPRMGRAISATTKGHALIFFGGDMKKGFRVPKVLIVLYR